MANSADPDEMPPYGEFHLGLHCSQYYTLGSFRYSKGSQTSFHAVNRTPLNFKFNLVMR